MTLKSHILFRDFTIIIAMVALHFWFSLVIWVGLLIYDAHIREERSLV